MGVRAPPIKVKRRGYYATHGRNGMWILDQNEKIGIFGFKILACIDGFSRYPIWWKVNLILIPRERMSNTSRISW